MATKYARTYRQRVQNGKKCDEKEINEHIFLRPTDINNLNKKYWNRYHIIIESSPSFVGAVDKYASVAQYKINVEIC